MDTAVEELSDLKEKIDEQIQEKRAAEPPPAVCHLLNLLREWKIWANFVRV